MTTRFETQIAVWSTGPSPKDEDRLILVLDCEDGRLFTRLEEDRDLPGCGGGLQTQARDVEIDEVLSGDLHPVFCEKLSEMLEYLFGAETVRQTLTYSTDS